MLSFPEWSKDAIWNDNPCPSSATEDSSDDLRNMYQMTVLLEYN